jgi:hypothetical protein
MDKRRKKRVLEFLEIAFTAVRRASIAVGPVSDADSEDVELCLHIGNAVEDLKAAMKEISK